jgi:NinB protein
VSKPFTLISAKVRDHAIAAIRCAPVGWQVIIREPKRGTDQNAVMWGLLDDFAKQVTHVNGQKYPKEAWKMAFMHQLGIEARFMPSLDGSETVPLGYRSSELRRSEMNELLALIEAEGAVRGVVFTERRREAA